MAAFDELARAHTDLDPQAGLHLQRLVASWSLLADLCFADLLLFAPLADGDGERFVILGQIRPTTSQTLYREDQVGRVIDQLERPVGAPARAPGPGSRLAAGPDHRWGAEHQPRRAGTSAVHPRSTQGRPGRHPRP